MCTNLQNQLYINEDPSHITVTSKKYGRFSKSIAYHILSNHEDADECINDAYLGVWNAIPPQRLKK
ncbi:sigma factor [Desulfitobacterium sp. PCE1]|uniref:sigma factor n=1 Tax=Desulfitobacterium sp. PCE1 TaxID=146907 RepID=UPI000A06455B